MADAIYAARARSTSDRLRTPLDPEAVHGAIAAQRWEPFDADGAALSDPRQIRTGIRFQGASAVVRAEPAR